MTHRIYMMGMLLVLLPAFPALAVNPAGYGSYLAFLNSPLDIALVIGVVVVLFLPQIVERIRSKTFRDEFADTTAEV